MSETAVKGASGQDRTSSVRRSRLATRLVIIWERFWPLVLPVLLIAATFAAIAWFGLFRTMSDQSRLGLTAIAAIGGLGALTLLRHFRLPKSAEVDARIERANRLEHTPLQVQGEQPGGKADIFADALWREHQRRMAQKLRGLSSDLPKTNLPDIDRWALRAVPVMLAVVAFAYSFGPSGGVLADAVQPGASLSRDPPRIDAWITPPAYTGKPPIFLTAEANREIKSFTVPTGSELSLRVTGGNGDETLGFITGETERIIDPKGEKPAENAAAKAPATPPKKSGNQQFAYKLADGGDILLRQGSAELNRWSFAVTPDNPPTIKFTQEPTHALNGTLELRYQIDDDYGAASGAVDLALAEPPAKGARPLFENPEVKLALPRRGAQPPVGRVAPNLTEHIWAGAPIALTLKATDAAGQEAATEAKKFILPQRPFTNPLSKALIEMRRMIGLDANQKQAVLDLIDAITIRPEDTIPKSAHYLGVMSARTRLDLATTDDQLRDVVAYFWDVATGIEDGELSDAEKRLRQAQQALNEALERNAGDEEIAKLMEELRKAMDEFLREFAERSRENQQNADQMPFDGQMLTQNDLQKMLDEIEKQAKSGNREQAMAMLQELQNMMNNLRAGPQQQQQQGQNGQNPMRQQMDKLGEMMRRQQELMNETHRLERERRNQEQGGQQQEGEQGQQGQQGQGMTPEEFAEAMRQLQQGQGQLQKDLEGMQEALKGLGLNPGKGFGEAGEQMGEAERSLGQQQGEQATGHQGQALDAMRRAGQDMMQQMMQAMQGEQGQSGENGRRQQNSRRDPLGRDGQFEDGFIDGEGPEVPSEYSAERARQILEAIRKRLGNALSPELEKQYLERLLEMQ